MGWSPRRLALLKGWSWRAAAVEAGHYEMADRLARNNYRLGIPIVVLSTLIGTSVFATLKNDVDFRIRIVVGMVSVVAAVLASLQTFLRYPERAEKHRVAATLYSALRRDIEDILAAPPAARGQADEEMERIKLQLTAYAKESPAIGEREWDRVTHKYELDKHASLDWVDDVEA